MNIHFTDDKILNSLVESTIIKIKIGSHMYGTNDNFSDIDYLSIYVPCEKEESFFTKSHHQFQYKDIDNNIDYLFISIDSFISNALSGDSTINFETIYSNDLKNSELSFLYDMRNEFINYKIVRSYLGLARRDYKHLKLAMNKRERLKKIGHIYRGYKFATYILQFDFSPILKKDDLLEIGNINSLSDYVEIKKYTTELMTKINFMRDNLANEIDSIDFIKYMSVSSQEKLHKSLISFKESDTYRGKIVNDHNIMGLIYDVNENGVVYN